MEDMFEMGIKMAELLNQKVFSNALPIKRYSTAVRKDMARFRPYLSRIARKQQSVYGADANPYKDLLRAVGTHLMSFCFTKLLRGPEAPPTTFAAPVVGPNVRLRRTLDPP